MADHPQSFYDQLAASYHLIFEDWDAAIERQGAVLGPVLEQLCGTPSGVRVLDCACGIGTQSLALANRGFRVTGCDFSRASVERARREAKQRKLDIRVFEADMLDLNALPEQDFDAVMCMDNALPHLETDEQLFRALSEIRRMLSRGKLFMASIRDYDLLLKTRPTMQEPAFYGDRGTRRIVHQVWDWIDDRRYMFHLYITQETQHRWQSHHYVSYYRALLREDLDRLLEAAGFVQCQWLKPAESGFYQPIVLARAQ